MPTLGPNTNASPEILAPACILCCGEDRQTLVSAMNQARLVGPQIEFSYRCYEFWKWNDVVVIWTGIGTGCLEPLLWEIFQPGVIQKIVLVGTAGKMPNSSVVGGQVYLINEAWLAGTGLDGEQLQQPLRPRWPARHGLPETSSVSTDFYYGFAPVNCLPQHPFSAGPLRGAFEFHAARGTGMVEMEVAQFYAFCENFPHGPSEYIAAKVCSNTVGAGEDQVANTDAAMVDAVAAACKMLGLSR